MDRTADHLVGSDGAGLLDALAIERRVVHVHTMDARAAEYATLAQPLPDRIAHCVPPSGLYRHQVEAIDLIRQGTSTVVATGTASGKSLCFQLPIAESVAGGLRAGTSLLLYPTKALAQDQLRSFGQLDIPGIAAATYDGDASREERTWARNNANVILTNPEMLHYGLLPHHGKWATFLKRLDYVVIDELHVFRGIFGSHLGHVIRRLRRLSNFYGGDPTFVFCSATIGQPEVLASELCGLPVRAVTDDRAARTKRHIALIQPAVVDAERQIRQSPATETIEVVTRMVLSGRRVIAFCGSRSLTERVAAGVSRNLPPELADTVKPYRSGYLAAERREIEAELVAGTVRAVITTSALELGVDIGGLDATVLCGFPGTVASMWQQIGRAGRGAGAGRPSGVGTGAGGEPVINLHHDGTATSTGEAPDADAVAVLVAGEDQLDQWFVNHPDDLFSRPPEPAVINVTNPNITDPHLGCAAYERPLQPNDEQWWGDLEESVRRNVLADQLRIRPDRHRMPRAVWDGRGMPFTGISLRSASGGELRIVEDGGDLIGTVELGRAPHLVHPGAIYMHRGQAWLVVDLDLSSRTAWVERSDGLTWTQAKSEIDIQVVDTGQMKPVGASRLHLGMVRVTTQVVGYEVKAVASREVLSSGDLDLPPEELETTSIWYEWDPATIVAAGIRVNALPGALHAAEHAAIGILPLFTICDRWDVGGVSIAAAPHTDLPSVFIYDGYPGGAGIADLAYAAADRHLAATIEVLETCPCATGCPSCVQSPKCGNGNEPLDKMAALALLVNTVGMAEPF